MPALIRRALGPPGQPRGSAEVQSRAGDTMLWESQPWEPWALLLGILFPWLSGSGVCITWSLWSLVSFSQVWGIGGMVGHETGAPGSKDEIPASHRWVPSSLLSLSLLLLGQS